MRKFILLLSATFVIIFSSCSSKQKIIIDIAEITTADAYIVYADPEMINLRTPQDIASARITDGKAEINLDSLEFNGKIKECTVTIVTKDESFVCNFPLPVEKGKAITLKITGVSDYMEKKSALRASYSGSKYAEDFSEFWQKVNDSFTELSQTNNSPQVYSKQVQLYKDYLEKYPESGFPYSAIISEMITIEEDDNPILQYCSQLSNQQSGNPWHNYLIAAYKDRQQKRISASALVFSAMDKNKNIITERDILQKVADKDKALILIDFWASWCKPCVESIPKLKEIYNKYHSKGLEVISISLDQQEQDWLKFCGDNPFAWLSLIGNGEELTQRYNFKYIPYVIIADKDGKVLQKNIEVDKLEKFISDYLNN